MKITTTGKPGMIVTDSLFGGNALFHIDHDVPVFQQKITNLGIGNLRWPGGSITESWFDPKNPDRPLAVARSDPGNFNHDEILSFTEVMTLAQNTGRAVDLVLPTRHILGPPDANGNRAVDYKAVAEITEFVKQALQKGGAYPDAKIASFEIGNEYWGSGGMTAKEYGKVANILSKAVQQGIDAAGSGQQPKILVQMGEAWGPDFDPGGEHYGKGLSWGQVLEQANKDVVSQLDAGARKVIDGLIEHYYPKNEGELSYDGWSHSKKLSVWEAAGMKLPTHFTEWNLNSRGLKDGQDVFASGSGLLETFEYMIRLGAQSAHVWPITQSTSSDLTGKAGGGAANLSSNGALFTLLSQNVRGLAWQNTSIEDIPEIESSYYTGKNKSVLFLTADDDTALKRTFDLSGLAPENPYAGGTLKVTQTHVVRDASKDQWVGKGAGAQIVAGPTGSSSSVAVDLKPYETVMVTLEWVKPPSPPPAPKQPTELSGTAKADDIRGTTISETIKAHGGDDLVRGNGGNDTILGGAGNDRLWGDAGNDLVRGEDGNDSIYGGAGHDVLEGGSGNDLLLGEGENDTVRGGVGNDTIDGGAGDDQLYGDAGNDSILGGAGNDKLWGGDGNDTMNGGAGNDWMRGDAGNDVINDDLGNDTVYADAGDDRVSVGAGNDVVYGGGGNDHVNGGSGNDTLYGEAGNDTLLGGDGHDLLIGGNNDDFLYGGSGNDIIVDGAGNDRLYGDAGNDVFYFGNKAHAQGGAGIDSVWGGAGADVFAFGGTSGFTDIMDFQDGVDKIRFLDAGVRSIKDITMRSNGEGDVVISYEGGQIRVNDIALAKLTAADFIF